MVDIIYQPIKEIVIMEHVSYPSPEKLALNLAVAIRAGQPAVLHWAEGVVFIHFPLPTTTEFIMKHFLDGRVYWSSVAYAPMPSFRQIVKVDTMEIPVLDVTANPNLRKVAQWLKEKLSNPSA
ncbi:hypothetical protein KEJ36_05830 [Candidatus Bathyarchaeota archaeon]|nr:hypothetical protein [Candidatus Bathyarchaeota archaeon]MBS7628300.1 hypothetical protein [Candidatus Bathyarchaeota archaeon]